MMLLQLVSVLVSDLACPVLIAAALCVGVYFQVRKYYEDIHEKVEAERLHAEREVMLESMVQESQELDLYRDSLGKPSKPSRKRK